MQAATPRGPAPSSLPAARRGAAPGGGRRTPLPLLLGRPPSVPGKYYRHRMTDRPAADVRILLLAADPGGAPDVRAALEAGGYTAVVAAARDAGPAAGRPYDAVLVDV